MDVLVGAHNEYDDDVGVEQNFVLWQELPEFSLFSILIAMVPFARSNFWIK